MVLLIGYWQGMIEDKIAGVEGLDLSAETVLSEEGGQYNLGELKEFMTFIGISLLILYLIYVLLRTVFKGLAWTRIMGKKFDFKFFKKFFALNLMWCSVWTIIAVGFLLNAREGIGALLFLLVVLLIIHFTNILYILFIKTGDHFGSIKKTLSSGISMLPKLAIPYVILVLEAYVIYFLSITAIFKLSTGYAIVPVILIVYVIYTSISKTYVYDIVKELLFHD